MDIQNRASINISGKKITILGAGKSGIAVTKLIKVLNGIPFISEFKNAEINHDFQFDYEIGGHTIKALDCELMVISPGISDQIEIVQKAILNGISVVSEIEFASWFTDKPILAITGSNGKTTTTLLLHSMCESANLNSELVGNIGIPFAEKVADEKLGKINPDVYVVELSSFQLEHIKHFSPKVSAITNIQSDHLDRYKNFQAYINAKLNITKNLKESDFFIYNSDDEILNPIFQNSSENFIPFSLENETRAPFNLNNSKVYYKENETKIPLYFLNECKLIGKHNIQNVIVASIMANCFGVNENAIKDAILNFNPVPHRIEFSGNFKGVKFYNDSKATNIDAVKVALNSFDNPLILILGGKDKGNSNFYEMIEPNLQHIKKVICYGDSGLTIYNQLENFDNKEFFENFEDAIKNAIATGKSGDIVLLSPGCASFDQFNSFEERGDSFKQIVAEYINE